MLKNACMSTPSAADEPTGAMSCTSETDKIMSSTLDGNMSTAGG